MVVVSHEMGFARAAAHRVILMADGEIVEQGSPEQVFEHPQARTHQGVLESHPIAYAGQTSTPSEE